MREIFVSQMDYIFFVYGLAFILLAAVCVSLKRDKGVMATWLWLGAFGLVHGINEWLDMVAFSFGDSDVFKWVRLVIMAVSFLALLEFGRSTCARLNCFKIGRWVYLPLLALALSGWGFGFLGINASVRYALGAPAGLWAALALWKLAGLKQSGSRFMAVAGGAMAVYAVVAGFIAPKSGMIPAVFMNHDSFLQAAGFPVQLLRAFLAAVIALCVWFFYVEGHTAGKAAINVKAEKRIFSGLVLGLILFLAGGVFLVNRMGQNDLEHARERILLMAQQAAVSCSEDTISRLSGAPQDLKMPEYQRLKKYLQELREHMPGIRFVYLMRRVQGKIIFLADSEPQGSKDESPPGQVYDEATPEIVNVFESGKGVVAGPTADRWGTWVSAFATIHEGRGGKVVAVLGIDQDAGDDARIIAPDRFAFIIVLGVACLGLILGFLYRWRFMLEIHRAHHDSSAGFFLRWGVAMIVILAGAVVTGVFFFYLRSSALSNFKAIFMQRAAARSQSVSEVMERQLNNLSGLRRLLETDAGFDRNEFKEYLASYLYDVPLQFVEWAPRVIRADRVAFEAGGAKDGL
ncbi:MAG: hypothetical protein HQL19_08620, partial [Candidatus Omnitrophica bacterium]|nr:hypothetical protein [Candidatus Omnitrophota bacterium]